MNILFRNIAAPLRRRLDKLEHYSRLNLAVARAAASFASRRPVETDPASWEASGFSQNGEDGILEMLVSKIKASNRYFTEIGSGNGIENNTSYLAHIKKYAGLQVEGNPREHKEAMLIKPWLVDCIQSFVDKDSIPGIVSSMAYRDPDVFSVDIDGMDYHVMQTFLEKGIRPGVIVVEYNSAFGPDRAVTIPYDPAFNMYAGPAPFLYYGVSLAAWKKLLDPFGYRFITVESNGVNAFFVHTARFDSGFLRALNGMHFRENFHQFRKFKTGWEGQYECMKMLKLAYLD